MKHALTTVLLACLAGASAAESDDAAAVTATDRLKSLGWLEGHWRGKSSDGAAYESVYSSPDAGMIVGASKEIAAARTRMFDFERMYVQDESVLLTPYPFGRQSVSFELVDHDTSRKRAVFVNPKHDFPKKFTYEAADAGKLTITLEGDLGGQPTTAVFQLERKPRVE